jgi:hypothetical protein
MMLCDFMPKRENEGPPTLFASQIVVQKLFFSSFQYIFRERFIAILSQVLYKTKSNK